MEFWNDIATDNSWKVLLQLRKRFKFTLIGGWAVYLLTKALKSKDIDMIVDFETLGWLKEEYVMNKNENLKKYEIKIEGVSVDVYVPYYSKLVIPVENILKRTIIVEGFFIPETEVLLILKQGAELNRKDSVKGQKDRIDILNLLIGSTINIRNYRKILSDYKIQDYEKRLRTIIKTARKEFEFLGLRDLRKIKLVKEEILEKLEQNGQ